MNAIATEILNLTAQVFAFEAAGDKVQADTARQAIAVLEAKLNA